MVAAVLALVPKISKVDTTKLYCYEEFNAVASAMDNSGLQDIFVFDVEGVARICVRLTVATNALAAFQISAMLAGSDGTYITLASVSADYTAPKGLLVGASADLTTLGVGSGWFMLDVIGVSKIKISANSSAAGGSTLAINGGGE